MTVGRNLTFRIFTTSSDLLHDRSGIGTVGAPVELARKAD